MKTRRNMQANLIYDVGLHNGDDTAYYLHNGFQVLAIEANPSLAAKAQLRFRKEIDMGRLTVLNVGVAESKEMLSFWINDDNDTWSSFDKALGCRDGTRCHEVKVRCLPPSAVLKQYGVPYYLKVDIEGSDRLCVRALDPKDLPRYISVELSDEHDLIAELREVGYQHFKVINQTTFTDSTPVFDDQVGFRVLRRASSKFPSIKRFIQRLPRSLRPKKIDFDDFCDHFPYTFNEGCSGPFGEETYGPWHSFDEIVRRATAIRRQLTNGCRVGYCWYDVHATW